MQLAVLGGGRMGEALVAGLLDAGFAADTITVAEISAPRRAELTGLISGVRIVADA
ncbi:MAG: pyrroline-5-carboxylate reductase, partial [Actinobacteria bacterium]|nr:pyrroline-5-carboxylate reductase [Actinomycetota bacterium]